MIHNPELQRHVWLELNWQRLMVTNGLLVLVFLTGWLLDGYRFQEQSAIFALTLFILGNYFMGSHLAGDSLLQEVQNHTWDGQRLSAQSAWTLAWGKILGANAFIWYISLVALALFALSAGHENYRSLGDFLLLYYKLIVVGFALHALSLVLGLLVIRRNRLPSRRYLSGLRLVVFLLVLGAIFSFESWVTGQDEGSKQLSWYGKEWPANGFFTISITLVLGWSLMAAWRLMGEELQIRQAPGVWLLFNLFLAVYLAGFGLHPGQGQSWIGPIFMHGFLVIVALGYLMAFTENKDPLLFKRIWQRWRQGNRHALLSALPCWLVSLGLLTLWLVAILLIPASNPLDFPWELPDDGLLMDLMILMDGKSNHVALYFFMVRDLGVMSWIASNPRIRRTDGAITAYFVVVYLLLPFLLSVGNEQQGLFLLLPQVKTPLSSVLAALVEGVLVLLALYGSQKNIWEQRTTP